jgi:hypothetical protein
MKLKRELAWPTAEKLLGWFIFYKIDVTPLIDMGTPDDMIAWLQEFRDKPIHHWHEFFWKEYEEFRLEYDRPDKDVPIE